MIAGDSSYFVALADWRDRWHRDALRARDEVQGGLLVTDLVLAEAVTIVGGRRGGGPAQTLYEYFVDACEVEFVGEGLLRESMALHLRYDGGLSVADCATVALMARRGIREVASFDPDFDRVPGIQRIP